VSVNGSHAAAVEELAWPVRGPTVLYEAPSAVQEVVEPATDLMEVVEPATVEVAAIEPEPEVAPEPLEPEPEVAPQPEVAPEPTPAFRQRGRIRRRARYLRRLREIQLRDIGGFMVELHRFQRDRPELVAAKVEGAAQTDRELRALQHALGQEHPLRELREAGVGGACHHCGAVHGSEDRFCASCGEPLGGASQAPAADTTD
jgi:hypothetical protein